MLQQLLRIGRHAIVSFPNFGHWRVRWQLLIARPHADDRLAALQWYDTPNIHLCTIHDFMGLCAELGIVVEQGLSISRSGRPSPIRSIGAANLFGEQGLFLLRRG